MPRQYTQSTVEEFIERYLDTSAGQGSCWPWTGDHNRNGYGRAKVGGRKGKWRLATHLVWERENGPVPVGMQLLHRCDNPPCCNPAHLFLGTQADNVADCIAKGRARRGIFPGSMSNLASITEADALAIREAYARGGVYQRELGAMYGLQQSGVSAIITGRTWAHVPMPESENTGP